MVDQFGRVIDYIRISVTDRCNLRCLYCMPEDGVEKCGHSDILTYDEIVRLGRIFVKLGIHHIKLTGGEPLVRRNLSCLVKSLKAIPGIQTVTLTTNGLLLKDQMPKLYDAGIDAVNISLDTLDRAMYAKITRRDRLLQALDGIRAVCAYPDVRLKLNCVPQKGLNDNQWVKMAAIAKNHPIDVRFIEMMPIGLGKEYSGQTEDEILSVLEKAFGPYKHLEGHFGNGPGTYVYFSGFQGKIGFISAISHKFCSSCNRIRLTSEGYLKLCLQYGDGLDLRALLRSDADDGQILQAVEKAVRLKPESHHFNQGEEENFEQKQMFRIGG